MEKEIAELRRRLAINGERPQTVEANASDEMSQCSEDVYCGPDSALSSRSRPLSAPLEPQPLPAPLALPRDSSIISQDDSPWRLEDVTLSRQRVARLFDQYLPTFPSLLKRNWRLLTTR
jgi:hypothetical protein